MFDLISFNDEEKELWKALRTKPEWAEDDDIDILPWEEGYEK